MGHFMAYKDGTEVPFTDSLVKKIGICFSNAVNIYKWRKLSSSKKFLKKIEQALTNADTRAEHYRRNKIRRNYTEGNNRKMYKEVHQPPTTYRP